MAGQQIHIISSAEIDAEQWDACIVNSNANKIYARHLYLQGLADNWSGLVINNYAAVMPLVWRRKWSIRYAYDAPFIQQLGLFGNYSAAELQQAVNAATKYMKYGDVYFNHTNAVQPELPAVRTAVNLIIPLCTGYEQIRKSYNHHLQAKLKKAAKQSLQYLITPNIELAVHTYQQLYAQRFPAVKAGHYARLIKVAKLLDKQQQCFVRQVVDKNNSLLAIALFFKDEKRIYNILPSTTDRGRKASAMHFLIDNVLKEFSAKPLIFDFEGSDVPGIKAFYQSFGAVCEPYFHLHFNHLPMPFKWLKR